MPTIMEQTTDNEVTPNLNPLTFPTLLYDKGTTQVTVTVIVSPSSTDPLVPIFQVPPITIVGPAKGEEPLPIWTVSWNFVIDSSLESDNYDIQIPAEGTVLSLTLPVQLAKSGKGQYTITFVTDDVTLSSFSYDIIESKSGIKKQFVEDPTIVVTPDPIIPP